MIRARPMLILIALVGSLALAAEQSNERAERRPNFVFILVDDLGWTDLGCFGSAFYETPNVDQLAARGMRFTQAYAACQVCSPTRASIMTGRYPARLNTTDYFGAPQPDVARSRNNNRPLLPALYVDRLPHEEVTIAEALKDDGYATFFAGKWHLGPEGFWPEDQGFDVNRGGITRGGPYGGKRYFSPYGNPRLTDGPEGEHLPDRLARETAAFVTEHRDRPFLAFLSFYSVHTPLMARDDLREKYEAKRAALPEGRERWGQERARKVRLVQDHAVYAGMVEAMDQAVGVVVAALRESGVEDDTVIIFMSDNGGLSTSEGHPTSNLPLRAGKGWVYEGGIREPMFIVWPGNTKPKSQCDVPVISTDFFPTMLEIAGVDPPVAVDLDGCSIVRLLTGAEIDDRPLFWHYPHYGNQGGSPCGAVRVGDWKLIEWFEDGNLELFNIADDLSEEHDVAAQHPDRVERMHEMLHDWRERMDARMPTPRERE